MAHSCRWRFPARPGGINNAGSGRRAGRIRVTASLRTGTGSHPNTYGLGPGFDAALQVSAAIGNNLQKFRDVFGEESGSSSGEEEPFCGFRTQSGNRRSQSATRPTAAKSAQEKKPRGRPPRALTAQRAPSAPPATSTYGKPEGGGRPPPEKVKRPPGRPPGSGDKRRGRPPASAGQRSQAGAAEGKDRAQGLGPGGEEEKGRKASRRTPLGSVQQQQQPAQGWVKLPREPRAGRVSAISKAKRLRSVKLKSQLKAAVAVAAAASVRKGVPGPAGQRRRRGRPPSVERLKAEAAAAATAAASSQGSASSVAPPPIAEAKQKAFRLRRDRDLTPSQPLQAAAASLAAASSDAELAPPAAPPESASVRPSRPVGVRQSPRRIKPVRVVPPSKRTDATIAKQLLQRAKKGAQKKLLEKEGASAAGGAAGQGGAGGEAVGGRRRRRTQLKNIRQFIMPVVSTVSLRIIKTPKRFIEDEASFGAPPPHLKMPRLETAPSSAASQASAAPSTPSSAPVPSGAPVSSAVPPPPPSTPPLPPPVAGSGPPAASLLHGGSCNNSTSNGRFSSSAASCGSSAPSQHSSQHSSQLSSGDSSRSSSPSLDSSCDSQASDRTQAASDEPDASPSSPGEQEEEDEEGLLRTSRPPSPPSSEPDHGVLMVERGRRGRRGHGGGVGPADGRKKSVIGPGSLLAPSSSRPGSQPASSTASSSSSPPPPPLLAPPQPTPSSEHHPHSAWLIPPHPIAPFIPSPVLSPLQEKRPSSILREPTFRWTSASRSEQRCFSSAKYAKEGLIRKPVFDNFRPPPLTAEDVGLLPPGAGAGPGGGGGGGGGTAGFPVPSGGTSAGTRLFSPLHHPSHTHAHPHRLPSSRFETPLHKRSPLLRAAQFTPSEAHSRIFESVTMSSPAATGAGSASSLRSAAAAAGVRTARHRGRRHRGVLGPVRGQPRSPSHSMTTRSSQTGKAPSELSPLSAHATAGSSPLAGMTVSALTPPTFSTFPPGSLGFAPEGPVDSYHPGSAGRRAATGLGVAGDSSSSSSTLFPLFGTGGGRERSSSASRDAAPRERDREPPERVKEREKENKKGGRKERERRGKGAALESASGSTPGLFAVDGKEGEGSPAPVAPKKHPGRKKSLPVDSGAEVTPTPPTLDGTALQAATTGAAPKGRHHKKGRLADRGQEAETAAREKEREKERAGGPTAPLSRQEGPPRKPPSVTSLTSMLAQAEKQQVADKRMAGLLKKAKDQLFKIEKNKYQKTAEQPKTQGQESGGAEGVARGPRIKHVCRRAAVALGRNRAVFPDDMPTLSALPWEEREKILSSMGNDDKSSVAGSEEAEPSAPPIKPIKPITRHRTLQEPPARKGRRSRRCGQCPGCQVPEDCGVCTNCLDKPKFGGRNIKKQCCKVRKCQNLQWMPSKAFLQKHAKGKKDKKKRMAEKKEAHQSAKSQPSESDPKLATPPQREEPARKKSETPPPKPNEEKQKPQQQQQQPQQQQPPRPPTPNPSPKDPPHAPSSAPGQESKQPPAPPSTASRKERKVQQPAPPSSSSPHPSPSPAQLASQPQQSQAPAKKEAVTSQPPTESKMKSQQKGTTTPGMMTAIEAKQKKPTARCALAPKQKPKDKEKSAPSRTESSTLNLLSTPSSGGNGKQKAPFDGVHRIRVDFKEDHNIGNVWEMGGLSVLTSVPITPRVICFLCASSGQVEFVFCQVCCEPFHLFCLEETERPLQEQWENWCCRRCRFCHVCGRQHQSSKQLLECDKCRNSYHPECLGPNHPTRPTKKKRVWICTKCVRCKSCGTTTPGKAWNAQWSHDFSLCHDCAKLFDKGNFCPLCNKCYDDDDYESKMMQCARCDRWVHAKCEQLTDEMYEILSNLPESVAYTCTSCTERPPAEWRTALEKELQGSVRQVLTALLNSRTSTHLLRYRQAVMKPPELNPETEESLPSRRSPEGPDPPVLMEVTPPTESPPDLESVKRKMDMGRYKAVLEFSDDIVKIIQMAINTDGGQPESRKANSMVKSFFIRQMERVFPWFKVKESRFWEPHKGSSSGLLPNAVLPPSLDHNYAQWQERDEMARAKQPPLTKKIIPAPRPKAPGEPDCPSTPSPVHIDGPDLTREDSPELSPPPDVSDNRQCALCLKYGDDNTNDSGRLLYIGQNEWTHVNCALWSAEVFEDDDGSLKNVHMAVIRGKQLRCEHCQRSGATVGCCLSTCTSNYHFMCARLRHCVFLEDKKVYCQRHRDLIKGEVMSESGFEVTRRILVDFEGINLRRKFLSGVEPENIHMMIGSMTVDCLGILSELSDCERKLFPIGYQCSRVYWSTLDARKRCVYTCKILVCCPPVVEADINSTVEQEDNRTIAHSPPSFAEREMSPLPESPSIRPSKSQPTPTTPRAKAAPRSRHPSYPPCQRSPGSRPLPSTGGLSSSPHEIVTVGDPLLTPGLRSIGSRRHSTSSLSPQPPRPHAPSPQRGRMGAFSSAPSLSTAYRGLSAWDTAAEKEKASGREAKQSRETRTLSPTSQPKNQGGVPERRAEGATLRPAGGQVERPASRASETLPALAGGSQVSPPLATAVLSGHQRGGSVKAEKGKLNIKELPAGPGLASRHPIATLPKDASGSDPVKEPNPSLVPSSKDPVNPGSPQQVLGLPPPHHKIAGRKAQELRVGQAAPTVAKPLRTSGASAITTDAAAKPAAKPASQVAVSSVTSRGISALKETRSKVRTPGVRESGKERGKAPQNSVAQMDVPDGDTKSTGALEPGEVGKPTRDVPLKARERFSGPERKNSTNPEEALCRFGFVKGQRSSHAPSEITRKDSVSRDRKRMIKVTLTPLKMDSNGTKMASTSGTAMSASLLPAGLGSKKKASRSPHFDQRGVWDSSESDGPTLPEEAPGKGLFSPHADGEDREGHRVEEGGEHSLEDGSSADKRREGDGDSAGSAKRRYPRRSARARSNMFFGLTPFYGVRSYGEEDLPFGSGGEGSGKRRAGGGTGKRSAQGQVDGADDTSTTTSGESGEEEEGGVGQCAEDTYYYNFTRTIISPTTGSVGMQRCLMGRGSQLHRFLKEDRRDEEREGAGGARRELGRPRIGQLDGVDDGSESDASVSAAATTTTTTSTTATVGSTSSSKGVGKRKGREARAEKEAENSGGGGGASNSRDARKNQKENSLPLGGVKSQGQDPLEAQLSLNTDLLKSDSDNTNSDDCGNILPSDIMEFVLNTPSMQALGQQPEASSSELLSLEEGFGLDANRGKDIGLFEDFPQPLPSAEPGESGVNASITGEEPYGLPLELPSDLSVLTTRSPSVSNQNHSALIGETAERPILSMPASVSSVEKGVEKQRGGAGVSTETQQGATVGGESQVTEGHMTPEHFIPDRMTSPPVSQVVEPSGQDLARTSVTPGLPGSPSVPLQGQKYLTTPVESSTAAQLPSTAVQTGATHLKPGPEKLIVLNQHMQPLYVLQTLPNGVTQEIQIGPSVSTTGAMDTSSMALAAGIGTGIPVSSAMFPAGGKGLVTMSHHPQIHTFPGVTQASFQPAIPSSTSSLIIGVHSQDSHGELAPGTTIVSSASTTPLSSATPASMHGKKRPLSRLLPRKPKKLARSGSQPVLTPAEVPPNMTLINFSPTQIPAGIPAQSGLVELGAVTSVTATSQRKVPNIIKRPKAGVVYFEPAPIQGLSAPPVQAGVLGQEPPKHLVPCTVSGLHPNQSVLNMVPMGPGSVSLSSPAGLLGPADMTGSIGGLLLKASQQSLALPEQQVVLQAGSPVIPHLSGPAQTPNTTGICMLPPGQTISMSVGQKGAATYHLQSRPPARAPADKPLTPDGSPAGSAGQDASRSRVAGGSAQSLRTAPVSRGSEQLSSGGALTPPSGRGKPKAKRSQRSPDKASGKKHKLRRSDSPLNTHDKQSRTSPSPGLREAFSPDLMEVEQTERDQKTSGTPAAVAIAPVLTPKVTESKPKVSAPGIQPQSKGGGASISGQLEKMKDPLLDREPKQGLMFEICSDDGFQIRSESIEEAWKSLTDKVQEARSNARLKELSFEAVSGLRMLGVIHDAVLFLLEQVQGARHCRHYRFRFHKPEQAEEPPINPHGSARAELHHRRSVFDMFNFLASKHRQPPEYNPNDEEEEEVQLKSARRATSMDLPMPMRFRHLKKASKEAVGVYRSPIHGRGLFCKRNIDAGEMVIEYSGNVIRSILTDKREKYYDSKGIGCYMFRIDDYEVVDATVHGNAARFINHSCEPNCYSRVINVEGQKHIVIFAMRKIYRGEELTYDYKFPIEGLGNKLPCNCGAKKCRKSLN